MKQDGSKETTGNESKSVRPDTESWELPRHFDSKDRKLPNGRKGFECDGCMIPMENEDVYKAGRDIFIELSRLARVARRT